MREASTQVQADLDRLIPLLDTVLTTPFRQGEAQRLGEAMRYSLEAGGKRVRPLLVAAPEDIGTIRLVAAYSSSSTTKVSASTP